MICVTPLEKRTKRWKTLVATRGEAAAYSLYFKYQGEVPESEYETPTGRYGDADPFIKEKYFYDIPDGTPAKSSTILERISTSTHSLNKVAQHLLPYVERINNSDIYLIDKMEDAGLYNVDENKIEINKSATFRGKGVESTIIHEVIHSLTWGSLRSNNENVQQLNELYEYLKPVFPEYNPETKEGTYALKNLDEFIVALFSDSNFIKELIKIPALDKSKSSFLQEVFDYILSLFNISEEDSIYRQAFNVASNILEDAALYSDFQKEQYEMMYYNSPQANPNFAAQLKQWHDTKGSYFSNTEQQSNDTYQRLVKFYTNAVVRRPYQTRNGKWVVTVKKPVDVVVEEDIKKVINEGYDKYYKTEIVKVGENQWMTPEGDIISEADAQDLMRFRDVQAPESLPKFKVIKPGVEGVFNQNPELASIGSPEQYSAYLDTIFPNSKVKDIVYHATDAVFERFKPTKPKFDTLNSIEGVYNFTTNKEFSKRYGKNILSVILNINNPIQEKTSGEFIDDMDRPLSEGLYKIGKKKSDNILAPKYNEALKNTDAIINRIEGDNYALPVQTVISVFEPEQIHILGTKQDVEGFKEFVSTPESLPKFKPIEYSFKSQEVILNNLDKIKGWEKQIKDPNILYRKIQELGIPKSQMELLINSDGNTVEDKLLSFLSNYSYTVEINTAKEPTINKNIDYETDGAFDEDGNFQSENTTFSVNGFLYEKDMFKHIPFGYGKIKSENGFIGNGEWKSISEREYEEALDTFKKKEGNLKPTQYYSNLTVNEDFYKNNPDWEYKEQRITTPLITPSIKGHAQFAEANDIGWFRAWYNKKTGEVHVLEVQSDLFQKGRDKEDLISKEESGDGYERGFTRGNKEYSFDTYTNEYWYVENNKSTFITKEEYEKAKSIRTDSKENQFLQLLNKDNNWVTFFVKSIIQDSAKKGYEKVLFPSGNTASKVEGHTTLEEFKKQKEDRIKELENILETEDTSTGELYESLDENGEVVQDYSGSKTESINREINQLKQELERVETEGFGALKPIYNFYENTVANVLKKQGYDPTLITDEYGNTWNEVNVLEITPENLIPKFKPKPANALNSLEVEQFRSALETSLQVGGTINFNYWSEGTSGEISNKDIEVLSVEDNTFVGRYPDGEERVFRFDNVVSKAVPGKYDVHEQVYFKSNLAVGKTINVTSNGLEYSGTVAEIGGDNFTILDPDGTMYTLKYADLDKENYERRIFQRASEMKSLLEEQIQRFSKNAKSKFQLDRIALLQQAVAQLDAYSGTVDLIKFMKLLQESVFKSKALMKTLSESEKDLDSMSESEKIEEVNRRLSKLSFLKDYVDSMMAFKKMAFEIAESDSSQELKDKAGGLALEIDSADNMYYEVAIPNIADWLWMCFPKKLNSQLLLIGEKEFTKERLIQELRQPTKDLDFLNSYGVPVANANDLITGLFSKAIKKVLQYAKINHINLEKNLLPFFKKVQATGAKMEEVYKKFYTIKQMETEEEVIVDGQPTIQKVTKNVRVFIEKYDLQSYYDTVRNFTSQIRALNDRIAVTDNTSERNALFAEKKKILASLTAYQKKTAINYSATQMNEMMEKLNKSNPSKFLDNLKFYTAGEETANSFKYTTEDGAIVYYNYKGNFYKPNKEAIDPDTGRKIFLTEDYENLMKEPQEVIDLYNEVKRIYDEKNNMLPEHLKMKGVVPVFYEQSMLKDLSKTISNRGKYNDAQELRKKDKKTFTKLNGEPYQNIPLGYTKILDVSESSDNIMQSFLLWANDVQMFKAKNDVIGSVENLTTVLEKNRPLGKNGEGKSKINRRLEVIKKYANQVLYGETRASNEWWDRIFDYMGKFTALTRMLIKPSSALNNLIIGNYALLSEAIGGRNFTTKELWRAHKKYVDLVANNKEKLNNMLITLDAIQGRFKDEIGTDFQTFQDTFGFNTAFSLNNLAEHQIQAVSMLALLEKWGVEVPENGMFDVDKLPDNFLGTLHELNKANNGVYSESDRLYHQDESLFRLFLQFRKYIVPTFRTKWSGMTEKGNNKYRMDLEAGTIELGYYRAFGEFVWNNVVKIKNLPNLITNYNSLNEIEKEGVWRGLVDGVAFASIGLLFLPLAGADDDDWDDGEHSTFENLIHWELIYQLARLRADIGTYIPGFGFSDQSRLVNQPFAAASTATQLAKIVGIVFDFEEDDEGNISIWKQYERDYGRFKKGDLKILQPISKLNPFDNPYEDLFPHVQYNDFKGASR